MFAALQVSASPVESKDPDTRAWWDITAELSNDSMEGRDTGSSDYGRAAQVVAAKFAAAGLQPLGEHGGWLQPVAMNEIRFERAMVTIGARPLKWLYDFSLKPTDKMAATLDVGLAYRGYCDSAAIGDVKGKLVICHGTHRAGLPTAKQRETAVQSAGGAGVMTIADPGFVVEPPRWPLPYARNVSRVGAKSGSDGFLDIRLNAAALDQVIGAGHDSADLIAKGSAGAPLPSFDIADRLHATFTVSSRRIASPNVLGMLPGTDPAKAGEAIVLSAHLDGYGHGESIAGDDIYNGTLDDAAYVALLIRLAERRQGKGYLRPLIFAAWTGEEKGLLGSEQFLAAPPLPTKRMAANINLDQLRPIFPLDLLTVHALDDTTLGDDARAVAQRLGIAVQRDPEPERNLLQRSDQWNFIKAGIPATAFVFGYRPGTESERIYRHWYTTGYHTPKDDLQQPIDWQAAADFNAFFYALVEQVAGQKAAPAWKEGSKLQPAQH
jgi:hypothetical protein